MSRHRFAYPLWITVLAVGVALTAIWATSPSDDMVDVPSGVFVMGSRLGSPDEQPPVQVEITGFEIDRTEVSNAEYERYLHATNRPPPEWWKGATCPQGLEQHPVIGISWSDAAAFCAWEGKRLPTEAEWEYACAGPDARTYPWGDVWNPDVLNAHSTQIPIEAGWELVGAGGPVDVKAVGSYPSGASPFGVLDMAGNASEWVADWFTFEGYQSMDRTNPVGLGPRWNHAVRGSAWIDPHGQPDRLTEASRCAARNSSHTGSDPRVGFRCVRSTVELPPTIHQTP